ncbi:MAG TPA: phosphodiester glycosidase family protein [Gemmatimonadaceae bacterium]|nr:phosphodiester glycosidase family protein [Gemmatimonadaceae bacterium]
MIRARLAAAALLLAAANPARAQDGSLALRGEASAPAFWHARSAPRQWLAPHDALMRSIIWRPTHSAHVEWAELELRGGGEARFTRVVVVRMDPAGLRFSLARRTVRGKNTSAPGWNLADAPADAVVALNAGQFTSAMPWGWLVLDGAERLAPGTGPLSSAFLVTREGRVEWVDGDALAKHRARKDIALAFQSYPSLLVGDGELPAPLHTDSASLLRPALPREADISRTHRDARLALGVDRSGRVLIALTRFDGLGGAFARLPFGFTVPEMAALMGALGAQRAMLLDGGISAQLLVRTAGGDERFSGLRRVPLALLVRERSPHAPVGATTR